MKGKAVTLLLLILAGALSTTVISASQDLIVNGGFETGRFQGWNADGSSQVKAYEYPTSPPHRGDYSASIGTSNTNVNTKGSLSQTVTIPEDSRATVSFWYRVEKGSSLDFYLREAGGTMIQNWTFHETATWTSLTYNLNPRYAGKSIVLTFEGKGYMETVKVPSPLGRDLPTLFNYYPYIDDVSVILQSVSVSLNVKISGLPSELSTKMFIDGIAQNPQAGGESKVFPLKYGDSHNLTVEPYVFESERVRYVCKKYYTATNASTDTTVAFEYTPQYRLTLESAYGTVQGTGWYDREDTAGFSVSPEAVPAEGFLGLIGVKHTFQGWSEDLRTSSPSGQISMDSAKKAVAVWGADYSSTFLVLGGLTAVAALLFTMLFKKRRVR